MSLEIKATITCDGCGAKVEGDTGRSSTGALSTAFSPMLKAEKLGWIRVLRYGPACHFCPACSDKPQTLPKIKRQKRTPPSGNCKMVGFSDSPGWPPAEPPEGGWPQVSPPLDDDPSEDWKKE